MSKCKIGLAECRYPNTCFKSCDTCVRRQFEDEIMAIKREVIVDERERIVRELEKAKSSAVDKVKLPNFIKKDIKELTDICFDEAVRIVRGGE